MPCPSTVQQLWSGHEARCRDLASVHRLVPERLHVQREKESYLRVAASPHPQVLRQLPVWKQRLQVPTAIFRVRREGWWSCLEGVFVRFVRASFANQKLAFSRVLSFVACSQK